MEQKVNLDSEMLLQIMNSHAFATSKIMIIFYFVWRPVL